MMHGVALVTGRASRRLGLVRALMSRAGYVILNGNHHEAYVKSKKEEFTRTYSGRIHHRADLRNTNRVNKVCTDARQLSSVGVNNTVMNNTVIEKRVALVTGSTSGIGLGIARTLASRGCSVILTGRREETLMNSLMEEFRSAYPGRSDYIFADLTKAEDTEKLCKDIKRIHPNGVDIIVNNAGFQDMYPVEEFPTELWDSAIAIMLTAPFLIIKHLLPDMKKKGWGRVINVSSIRAQVADVNKAAYVTCKHGIIGLTKVVALESAENGITCNAICPGCVNTPMFQGQLKAMAEKEGCSYEEYEKRYVSQVYPTKSTIDIDQLAETVIFLCSDAASQMTGTSLFIDGGRTAR